MPDMSPQEAFDLLSKNLGETQAALAATRLVLSTLVAEVARGADDPDALINRLEAMLSKSSILEHGRPLGAPESERESRFYDTFAAVGRDLVEQARSMTS